MSKKFIIEIEKKDSEKIENIYDRMCSLKALGYTLIDNNEYADKASEFYERLINDRKNVEKEYRIEWDNLVSKYGLDPELTDKYELQFRDNCIYIKDSNL